MKRSAALFPIALALGAMILAPRAGAQPQGPTEIATCETINQPGSYLLVRNLTATGDCLRINADFVTIPTGWPKRSSTSRMRRMI